MTDDSVTAAPPGVVSAALTSATTLAGPGATVDVVRQLSGGSHATTHLVRTANPRREFILRSFPPVIPPRPTRSGRSTPSAP